MLSQYIVTSTLIIIAKQPAVVNHFCENLLTLGNEILILEAISMYKNSEKPTNSNGSSVINAVNEPLTKNSDLIYNGAFSPDEDSADYLRAIKGVRLG